MAYAVTVNGFEGPIDLLLHLVTSHEVDVVDLPLAPVVDAFVAHLRQHGEDMTMDVLSEFLLIAAILVELKSQRLLPGRQDVDDDEELVGWEERDLLLARLLECRAYAAAADAFVGLSELAARSIPREVGLDDGFVVQAPDLLAGVTVVQLAQAYLRGTAERPEPRVDLSHVTVDTLTVFETVQSLAERLPRIGATTFRQLTAGLATRIELIVHFLALLELCKRGRVTLGQGVTFGDLDVRWLAEDPALTLSGSGLVEIDDYEG